MKKKAEELVREALLETGLVIPVNTNRMHGGWEFLCRQIPGQEKTWLLCVEALLRWSAETLMPLDEFMIARKYLLKDDRMVFGWYLKLKVKAAPSLIETSESMTKIFKMVEPAVVEVPRPRPQQTQQPQTFRPIQPQAVDPTIPRITVISRSVDSKGNVNEITEMPLAHVNKDLNVPTKPVWSEKHGRYIGGDKGAKSVGGGG